VWGLHGEVLGRIEPLLGAGSMGSP
jgi:hypothetical protein